MSRTGQPDELHDSAGPISGIVGSGPTMQEVFRMTRRVAKTNASVLILGETGVGKELIANAIHRLSHRKAGPFVKAKEKQFQPLH